MRVQQLVGFSAVGFTEEVTVKGLDFRVFVAFPKRAFCVRAVERRRA